MKTKESALELDAIVVEAVKNSFRVEVCHDLDHPSPSGMFVSATLGGKLRQNNIRVVPGDKVKIEVSPYDMTRGRITYRIK